MTMSIVQIGYGKVNYDVSSATLTSFVVEQPFDRVLASKALSKSSQTQRLPSSDTPNINGWLYHDTLNAPDGTIILVQMQARSHGLSVRDGSVFLRVRDGGPMMLIIAKFEINIIIRKIFYFSHYFKKVIYKQNDVHQQVHQH